MDIKLKNSNSDNDAGSSKGNGNSKGSKRIAIAIAGIVLITVISMCFFPAVYRTAEQQKEQRYGTETLSGQLCPVCRADGAKRAGGCRRTVFESADG